MRILLDTHVWLWMLTRPEHLGSRARAAIEARDAELRLSAASSWEIAIKYALGRLPLPEEPERFVPRYMEASRVTGLAIQHRHALAVAGLAAHHRDPFDRLLIVQAQLEDLTILTADAAFSAYDVTTMAAI